MINLKNKGLLITLVFYMFITINLIIHNNSFYINIINPLFWGCILIYLIWDIKKNYVRFYKNKKYIIYIFIISCIHIILYFYIGFIFGFTKSPYNHKILSIIKNCFINVLPIISIEITRCVILTRNKNNKLLIVFLTLLLIFIETDYHTIIYLFSNKQELFEYICSNILPLIASSCLFTYLTLKGSYILPLIYRLFIELLILLLPILPDIDWFLKGSTCILSPTLIYILFKYVFTKERNDIRKRKENLFTKISYSLTFIICISLICFMLGVFKYEPIAILSNSMYPTFSRGDVVIFKKLNDSKLKEIQKNTTIIYSIDDQNIAHRIVKVIHQNETTSYQTKGDNNNSPDIDLVQIEQIKGIYTFHIKYIGFPSVWLYEYFNSEKAKVETN